MLAYSPPWIPAVMRSVFPSLIPFTSVSGMRTSVPETSRNPVTFWPALAATPPTCRVRFMLGPCRPWLLDARLCDARHSYQCRQVWYLEVRAGEQVIVNVGNDGEPKATLERP